VRFRLAGTEQERDGRIPPSRRLAYHAAALSPRTSDPATRLVPRQREARGDDPIFALNAEARRRRAAGESVVNSTLGALLDEDERLATLPSVADAYRRVSLEAGSAYAPIAGPPAFLAAVVADLLGSHPLAARAQAVATPGGTGALALAVQNFLAPGESLLTTSYFWSPYETIAHQAGCGVDTFAMFTPEGRFDVRALEAALADQGSRQPRTLLFLNTPCHNPTGYSLDEDDWRDLTVVLRDAAARQRLTVLLDLAYARYGSGDERAWIRHLAPLVGEIGVLVAWSASKSFLQYGARVGACVALEAEEAERERIHGALSASCRGLWSNGNHLGMLAITECLRDPELRERTERERGALQSLLAERVALFTRLARERVLPHPRYEGGFFVTVFADDSARAAAHLRTAGVFVVPIPGALRVAVCSTPLRSIPRLVEALAQGLDATR